MLVVTRFAVAEADGDGFADQARAALGALAARPGYRRGHLGRAVDDPTSWLLLTEWDGVGAYRRALSAYEVRITAVPLLALGQPEPGAFEVLSTVDHAGADLGGRSDRAADAGSTGPGGAPPAHLGPPPGPAQPPMPASAPLGLPGADRAPAQAPVPPRSAHRTGQESP